MKVNPLGVRQSAELLKHIVSVTAPASYENLLKSTASLPLDSLKPGPVVVAQRVQSTTEWHAATRSRSVGVVVIGIQCSMEVEVLLDVDERDVVFGEQLSNAGSVGFFVTRDIVAVQNSRETGDIERQGVELSGGLSDGNRDERRESTDGSKNGVHDVLY
jgi:hypothetical protein